MGKLIEKITVTAPGMNEQTRARLEDRLMAVAADFAEEAEMDRQTEIGIAEFERGEFITIEEFGTRMDALADAIRKRSGS